MKIRCRVRWPNTQSTMDFRAKTKTDAMSLAKAWVDHLVAPMHVEIDVSEDGVHLVKAEAHGDHIHQALEAAFT